jgi:hypothetical protein
VAIGVGVTVPTEVAVGSVPVGEGAGVSLANIQSAHLAHQNAFGVTVPHPNGIKPSGGHNSCVGLGVEVWNNGQYVEVSVI